MAHNEDSSASGHDEPWIQWFCGLKGHEMFCEVERSYIEDGFNLYGLRACVGNFSDCLDLILDRIGPDDSDDSHLTQSACTLYGLIHARYIITAHGLDAMYSKYAAKDFGACPLIQCAGQPVLPVGMKDEMGADTVKIFCPKCNQVYFSPPVRSRAGISSGVDGAAFGTTFPHLFLMTFSNLVPDPLLLDSTYVPRVFGFRVHKSARQTSTATVALALKPAEPKKLGDEEESTKIPVAEQEAAVVAAVAVGAVEADDTKNGEEIQLARLSSRTTIGKRRKDEGKKGEANGQPSFLMDSNTKRRRRNTGNS
jgi:casein kinase II subunit beta